jgi:sugar lactone lactonase YvrE
MAMKIIWMILVVMMAWGAEPVKGLDREGRLVVCEAERRVSCTEKDVRVTVLAERYEGKRFNSPNDLSMDTQGRIHFSDPRYGKREGMEMGKGVYRFDGPGQVVRVSAGDRYLSVANYNNYGGLACVGMGRWTRRAGS